jgi:hypothetical protein
MKCFTKPYWFLFSLLLFGCCYHQNFSSNSVNQIVKIHLVYQLPFYPGSKEAELVIDSSNIYYYKHYRVYELNRQDGRLEEEGFELDSVSHYFVIVDTIKKTALYSRYLASPAFKKIDIDSFIKGRPDSSAISQFIPIITKDREVKTSKFSKTIYYKVDNAAIDSLILGFNKSMIALPFSYSRYFDSLGGAKLARIEIKLKKDTTVNAHTLNKLRRITWQLTPVSIIENEQAIAALCERSANFR